MPDELHIINRITNYQIASYSSGRTNGYLVCPLLTRGLALAIAFSYVTRAQINYKIFINPRCA